MPKPITLNRAKAPIDFQTELFGVSETIGDLLADELDTTNVELKKLLEKELPVLKRWKLSGNHSLQETAERWDKLKAKIAAIRSKGIKTALKQCLSDMQTIGKAASNQTVAD